MDRTQVGILMLCGMCILPLALGIVIGWDLRWRLNNQNPDSLGSKIRIWFSERLSK